MKVCLFRYLRAAVCLNCLPNLPFNSCHDSITTQRMLFGESVRVYRPFVGFPVRICLSAKFRRTTSEAAAIVARFSCCETLRPQLRRRDSTQQALHMPHLHFEIQPRQLQFQDVLSFVFSPCSEVSRQGCHPRHRQIVLDYSIYAKRVTSAVSVDRNIATSIFTNRLALKVNLKKRNFLRRICTSVSNAAEPFVTV